MPLDMRKDEIYLCIFEILKLPKIGLRLFGAKVVCVVVNSDSR
jgi:hypothetical protein